MTEQMLDVVINLLVNVYQGFIITWFLERSFSRKEKYSKMQIYMIGAPAIFVYLQIQVMITDFEGLGVLALWVFTSVLSMIFFEENMIKKLLYNAILIISMVFVATLVGSIIGIINSTGYIELVSDNSAPKYVSMLVNQVVIWIVFRFVSKFISQNKMGLNVRYTILVIVLSVTSVFTVVALHRLINGSDAGNSLLYTFGVIIGIIALVVVSLIMYGINEKTHMEKLQQEIEINAYKQQKRDVEEISKNYREIEKVRHEMNKVIVTTLQLIGDEKYIDAKRFIEEFQTEESNRLNKVHYTDNIVLNYVLNQKLEICQANNICVKYVINGEVDGIKDIDIHCIVSNLLDNAIEATKSQPDKSIELSIFGNKYSLLIEVSNTTTCNILQNNPSLQTSKSESGHGYGVKNIKDAAEKYSGQVKYVEKIKGYFTCQVVLMKEFTTEMGNSRQNY